MGRNFVQRAAKFRLAFACRRTSLEEIALLANEALFGVMTSINECVEYAPIGQLDRIVEGSRPSPYLPLVINIDLLAGGLIEFGAFCERRWQATQFAFFLRGNIIGRPRF